MARVAIVGVGAIGGALAWLLESAGQHELTLCTRRPLLALTVDTPRGVARIKTRNGTDPARAEAVDWVIVATKTYDAEGAAAWFPALCANGAPVAVVQNGVEHRERFAPWLGADRILPVVIECPTERQEDGIVQVRGKARMKVEDTPLGAAFAQLFAGSAAEVELTGDFTTAAWRKLCINSVGALNALTVQPDRVLRSEAMNRLALEMVAECVAVGRAEGARLDDSMGEEVMEIYRNHPPDSINSLLADRMAGRRMETGARNGAIVRKGEKHGIPTPLTRMAVALLEAVQP
jgi:2-dehydropantoate 2-reductase